MDVRDFDIGHQAVGHDGCLDDRTDGHALDACQAPRQSDAGDEHMLLNIKPGNGLNKRGKALRSLAVGRRQTYMTDLHALLDVCSAKNRSKSGMGAVVVHVVFAGIVIGIKFYDIAVGVANKDCRHFAEAEGPGDFDAAFIEKRLGCIERCDS